MVQILETGQIYQTINFFLTTESIELH